MTLLVAESLVDHVVPARRGVALLGVVLVAGPILAVIWVVEPAGRLVLDLGFRAGITVAQIALPEAVTRGFRIGSRYLQLVSGSSRATR